jgi:hypothetical protein
MPIELLPTIWLKTNSVIQIEARNVVKDCGRNGGSVASSRGYALATW